MPTILGNGSSQVLLHPTEVLTLVLTTSASVKVVEMNGAAQPIASTTYTLSPTQLGPYPTTKILKLEAVNGSVTYIVSNHDERYQEGRILAQSGVALPSANSTGEQALATITIPGGTLGPNGAVLVRHLWTFTNNANVKTVRVRLGGISGTIHSAIAGASALTYKGHCMIMNRGAQDSQVGQVADTSIFTTSVNALVTGAIDTSVDQDLIISIQKATGTDVGTLEAYSVELNPMFV